MGRTWGCSSTRYVAILVAELLFLIGCGGGGNTATNTPPPAPAPTPSATVPAPTPGTNAASAPVQHVVVVVEENHSYESVIGSLEMPYFNALANKYALATAYYADTHPSIGNYFMMTTGAIVTNDDAYSGTVTGDNLARALNAAGKSWKVYAENLPSSGYLGDDQLLYLKHHNPFAYFSDVTANPAQANNIVDFSQFATDLVAGKLPNFAFVVPNILNDGHSGTLVLADAWLRSNIDPLLNNAAFQQSGLLFIVFDEGDAADTAHGGGHVAAVLAGSKVKLGYKSTTFFQHASALRLFLDSLGVSHPLGASASAPSMSEMLQ